jgi:branched-chain amino acid transport system substrate-binding protein
MQMTDLKDSLVRLARAVVIYGLILGGGDAFAQAPVRIGVLTDMTGPLSAYFGPGSVAAAKLAVEDFGPKVLNRPIEVVSADHQNKPDVALGILRQWFDIDGVDAVADLGNSSVALAAQNLVRDKNRVALFTGASTTKLVQENCSPNGVQWGHDVYMFSHGTTKGILASEGKTWYLVVVDYVFGKDLEAQARQVIESSGGKVVGVVHHPLNTPDLSSFLLQAQGSGAQVIGLLNSVQDLANSIKQASEFQITPAQRLAALALTLPDLKALGLGLAQGITYSEPFYWDRTDETRAFSQRFFKLMGSMPTGGHAATYSAVLHYLKSMQKAGTTDGKVVVETMKQMPVDDMYAHGGVVRADGRLLKDVYLLQVKTPKESSGPWDLVKVIGTVSAADAWAPPSETCPLVK